MGLFDAIGNKINSLPSIERRRLENEIKREQLSAMKRQNSAIDQMGLLFNNDAPSAIRATPEQTQQRMMGLLPAIAPQSVAQGLLSTSGPKESRYAPQVRELESAMGRPLSQDEMMRLYGLTEGEDLQDIKTRLEISGLLDAREQDQQQRSRNASSVADAFANTIRSADELLKYNNQLEGSFLESGSSFQDWRKAGLQTMSDLKALFGGDTAEDRQVLSAYNSFDKVASGFAIDLVSSLENATNQKFDVLRSSIANLGVDPQTNRRIIGDVIADAMQEAKRNNIDIPQDVSRKAQQMINEIQKSEMLFETFGTGDMARVVREIPGFYDLDFSERSELIRALQSMSPNEVRQYMQGMGVR